MLKFVKDPHEADYLTKDGEISAGAIFCTVIYEKLFNGMDSNICRIAQLPEGELKRGPLIYGMGGEADTFNRKDASRKNGVPYSLCGRAWVDIGWLMCQNTKDPYFVWKMMDEKLFQGIDAVDNKCKDVNEYEVNGTSITQAIAEFNSKFDDAEHAFLMAFEFACSVYDKLFEDFAKEAESAINEFDEKSIAEAFSEAQNGVLVLNSAMQVNDKMFELEAKYGKNIQFVIIPSNWGGYNCWRVSLRRDANDECKKSFPNEFFNLNEEELENATGIKGATYVYRVVAGASSLESAKQMALKLK